MEFHEAASIFPLDGNSIPELVADIKKNGLKVQIETLDGKIIDGRRRWEACQKARVSPTFKAITTDDPVAYVVSVNLHKKNLSIGQLAMCAGRACALFGRQEASDQKGPAPKSQLGIVSPRVPKIRSRDIAGVAFGISGRSVGAAIRVLAQGVPELVDAVDRGEMPVRLADRVVGLGADAQREVLRDPMAMERFKKDQPVDLAQAEAPGGKILGVGVFRAHEALNILTRIPRNDPLRQRGLQIVKDWIRHNS